MPRSRTSSRSSSARSATGHDMPPTVPADAPDFVKEVTAKMIEGKGDELKVSQMPDDGTWPTGTTQYEKRNIAVHVPEWLPENCIQCGQCSLVCPHAAIRMKIVPRAERRAEGLQDRRCRRQGVQGFEVHHPGLHRGLLRLHPVRQRLPGQDQGPADDTEQLTNTDRSQSEKCEIFPESAGDRSGQDQPGHHQGQPAPAAALRVLRRLRRLRRDPVHQAGHPAVRRPDADRQRHRLFLDLRRQPAHHPVLQAG